VNRLIHKARDQIKSVNVVVLAPACKSDSGAQAHRHVEVLQNRRQGCDSAAAKTDINRNSKRSMQAMKALPPYTDKQAKVAKDSLTVAMSRVCHQD
jgi:hypothetical protein